MSAIKIKNLKKKYKDTQALKGIDLEIEEGEVFGLLGRNGAGKTTTINIITGFVKLEEGSITVLGKDVVKDYKVVRKSLGIASQEFTLDMFFTIRKLLEYQAGYYGLDKKETEERVEYVLKAMDLKFKEKSIVRTLSGGMKRRLMIAKALIHNPQILILDEPTAGVDVDLRKQTWNLIRKLKKEGMTILLTTHYLEEAEQLCDRVAIIEEGKILVEDTPQGLIGKNNESIVTLKIKGLKKIPKELERFSPVLFKNCLRLKTKNGSGVQDILKVMSKNKIEVDDLHLKHRTLEDVFIKLTGKEIDE